MKRLNAASFFCASAHMLELEAVWSNRRDVSMFVGHLESALDGTKYEAGRVWTVHQGRPLWVRYHLAQVRQAVCPEDFASRPPSLWRYRELLPLPAGQEPVTLGEGMTPILPCARL